MHEHHLQKNMFNIESKSKRGFEKGDMHVVITIELTTIVSSILTFQLELIPMFFHMDSIRKFRIFIQSWRSPPIVVIVIGVKGIRDSKGEKQLLTTDGKDEFNQIIFILGNNFKTKYELLEAYNGGQCGMGLIKNVTTSKGDRYLKAKHYTILTKVVNKVTQAHLLQLHNKLSSVQHALKKENSFPILYTVKTWLSVSKVTFESP